MERQLQKAGERPWGGAQLIKLQDQLYEAIEAQFKSFNKNFVISGCEITGSANPFTIAPGIVFIDGNICKFEGAQVSSLSNPIYIDKTLTETTVKTYGDLIDRATEVHYLAIIGSTNKINLVSPLFWIDVVSPKSDSIIENSSSTLATSKAVYTLHEQLKPGTQKVFINSTVEGAYRKTNGSIRGFFTVVDVSPGQGAALFTLDNGWRPTVPLLVPVGSGHCIRVNTNGEVTLHSDGLPGVPGLYYQFEFMLS